MPFRKYLLLFSCPSLKFTLMYRLPSKPFSKFVLHDYKKSEFLQRLKKPPLMKLKLNNLFHTLRPPLDSQRKKLLIANKYVFQTSSERYLHPFVWIVLKPIMKLTAVLSGRGFRKWWKDLPPKKRKYFLQVMQKNRNKIGISIAALCCLFWIYYESHIQETPITKRKRFIAFNPQQLEKVNEFEFQQIMEGLKGHLLAPQHPATKRVIAVVRRILDANVDIDEVKKKHWNIAVIGNPIENAFVLPSGYVFVFTGMLNLCSNDDQLGTVLAHEIAHCLMGHGIENLSFTHLLDLIAILVIAAIWAILPSDSISILTHWLFQKMIQISLQLPYSRKIETEADEVGLELAAKACYDVRESSAFWSKMSILNKTFGNTPEVEFLSTHPSHETRSEHLDSIMDKALKTRMVCNCPSLKSADPRLNVEVVSKLLEAHRKDNFRDGPKPINVIVH